MSFRILGVGEVLWDLLPGGPQLGGAPANFACHAAALGHDTSLVSRVGRDALGLEAVRRLGARRLDLSCLSLDDELPTGVVDVAVGVDGRPEFQIAARSAWDALRTDDAMLALAASADALCFGTLAQRTLAGGEAVRRLVAATRPAALRVFDVNLRAPFFTAEVIGLSLELANVLKLNETELPVLADQFGLKGGADAQLEALADRFGLRVVALTLGSAGSRLWRDGLWTAEPARRVSVTDAVGAGDSFTAALVAGLLRGWDTGALLAAATDIAAFVCTQSGATPELPEPLTRRFLAA